jgi:hypothetical protein
LAAAVKLYELGRISSGARPSLPESRKPYFYRSLPTVEWTLSGSLKRGFAKRAALSEIICNTSPLQYLHQLSALHFLPALVKSITPLSKTGLTPAVSWAWIFRILKPTNGLSCAVR